MQEQEPFFGNYDDSAALKSLADRARLGDSEAFGELVTLHRARMLGVAKRIVHDRSDAEDVVQEALVQAFLYMNRLSDPGRFLPWLNRIVRNQALMKRRKDVRLSRESTFTAIAGQTGAYGDTGLDWSGLDDLLFRLTPARNRNEKAAPEAELMKKEFYEALRSMLHTLSQRERDLFEAHFLSQLTPHEIAGLLGMTEGNVYKSLSRLKTKMKRERVRSDLRDRLDDAGGGGERRAKVMLPLRTGADARQSTACSIATCIHRILQFKGHAACSLSDVMGWTGYAFRISLERERIDVSGPSMYFWEPVLEAGLKRLGLQMTHAGDGGIEPSAHALGEAVMLARRSIAAGTPVAAWDLNGPEFGLLYGYDDEQLSFSADAPNAGAIKLAYDKLGRGKDGGLFVMAVNPLAQNAKSPQDAVPDLFAGVLAAAYGERTFPGYVTGLTAYEAWRDSIRNGAVDPIGQAYSLRVVLHAREHAVRFLRGLSRKLEVERARLAFEAEGHYYAAVHALAKLAVKFPFPSGGDPLNRKNRLEAETLLLEIKNCEEAGLETLERLARRS
ncbi:RNA polymerase sigma factor [Paenibacillus humicola]|uniref:RNA polymerase sigma factor n=1 Tax=Paenibacillus humicola TaxID=3110540 RepID=UPI00237B08E7|nr:sigma-70 family RNA polymerase sigma factor [Paenibacillus humicola]